MQRIVTSESVTEGHPDKVCDYIADSVLDYILERDPDAQTAIECSIKNNRIFLFGEASTDVEIPFAEITGQALNDVGYEEEFQIDSEISVQSPEINRAVLNDQNLGAGDQGIMFGYACSDTAELMPAPIYYAHRLTEKISEVRKSNPYSKLRPDGKAQVSVIYNGNEVAGIHTIVVSVQHAQDFSGEELRDFVIENIIKPVIPEELMLTETKILVNPSGSFVLGGPYADSGTTGRKIVCDSYGADGHVGGGCYSSKSPTKVDRAAAYYCRYVAKSLVANGLAEKCEVQVAYAIGVPDILSLNVNTFNTSKYDEAYILEIVRNNFDFSVSNIIRELDLKKPVYRTTTNYGHFGKPYLSWEKVKVLEIPETKEGLND